MGRLIAFAPFLLLLLLLLLLLVSKFCPDEFFVTTGRIVLKFEDMGEGIQQRFKMENVGL